MFASVCFPAVLLYNGKFEVVYNGCIVQKENLSPRGLSNAYATFSHVPGTRFICRAVESASIASETFQAPPRPSLSSESDVRISEAQAVDEEFRQRMVSGGVAVAIFLVACGLTAPDAPLSYMPTYVPPRHVGLCQREGFRPPSSRIQNIYPAVRSTIDLVCSYVDRAHSTVLSRDAWTADVEKALTPGLVDLKAALAATADSAAVSFFTKSWPEGWLAFSTWLNAIILESAVMELRCFSATVDEYFWARAVRLHGAFGTVHFSMSDAGVPDASTTLTQWKQSGNLQEAQRFFKRMLNTEQGNKIFPYRFFYDTYDYRRVDPWTWPGMRKLHWPNPLELLGDVGTKLASQWRQIADQTRKLLSKLARQPDAYGTH